MMQEISSHGKDFITIAMRLNPEERPSMVELLKHPWITTHCKNVPADIEKMGKMSISDAPGSDPTAGGWTQLLKAMDPAREDLCGASPPKVEAVEPSPTAT